MKKQTTLTKKAFGCLIILFSVLIIGTSIAVSIIIYRHMMEEYFDIAVGCSSTIADSIDGDRIPGYMSTRDRDEYYYQVRDSVIAAKDNFDLMYCYVFYPGDEIIYIWDADDEGENIIGTTEPYSDGGKEVSAAAFSTEPKLDFLRDTDEDYGEFMTSCVPVYNSNNIPVALVAADISTKEITDTIREVIINELLIIALIMLTTALVYIRLFKKILIRPLTTITDTVNGMVDGVMKGSEIRIDVHTNDELDILARAFEKMHGEILNYIEASTRNAAEKERIRTELDMARSLQLSQLPQVTKEFTERSEFTIYASMQPAKEVGGDFYDFFFIDDDHLALIIADVSGKGIPAGLFMMMSKILINNFSMMGLSPHEILEKTNKAICANNKHKMFVTVWLGIMELSTGKFTAANAGHEKPLIAGADGRFELMEDIHGSMVGVFKNKKYSDYEFTLEKGGALFVYTDGVPEATDTDNEQYGTDRLIDALRSVPQEEKSPERLIDAVCEDIARFVGSAPQFDDTTMLAIIRN